MPKKDGFADTRNKCIQVGQTLAERALKAHKGNSLWARMSLQEGVAYLIAKKEVKNETP